VATAARSHGGPELFGLVLPLQLGILLPGPGSTGELRVMGT